MDEKTFQEKLQNLIGEFQGFPDAKRKTLEILTNEIGAKYEALLASLKSLQDTVDTLRLNVQYILFDLEATKRENIALRRKLEE